MAITLYGFDGSTYVRTVRMLLAEKGAQYDQVPVHVLKGEPRQPEHLARHPFGKVPVVDHDGFRILETSAIAPYLDEVLPGPSFMPDNARVTLCAHAHVANQDHRLLWLRRAGRSGGLSPVPGFHWREERGEPASNA